MSARVEVDVVEFLESLGIENVREQGDEVSYSCPFDGHARGDSNPSASMNRRTTGWNCWGCGEHGNAVEFLAKLEGIPPHRASRYIREHFDSYVAPKGNVSEEIEGILRSGRRPTDVAPDEDELGRRSVDWSAAESAMLAGELKGPSPLTYMLDERGFSSQSLESWEIGFDVSSGDWVTIPYRDLLGRLVGFKGRNWRPGGLPRYKVLGDKGDDVLYGFTTFDVSAHVYGLHRCRRVPGPLYVFEGELNAVMAWQRGFERSVGISSQHLSTTQASLIVAECDHAVLTFDERDRAIAAARRLEERIRVSIVPEHDRDPCEMNPHELRELLLSSESSRDSWASMA